MSKDKFICALNVEGLAVLGLIDEVYDEYQYLISLYNSNYEVLHTQYPYNFTAADKAIEICCAEQKKWLNHFFEKYYKLFSENDKLYVNDIVIKLYPIMRLEPVPDKIGTLCLKTKSFAKFVNSIEYSAIYILRKKRERNCGVLAVEKTADTVNDCVAFQIDMFKKTRSLTADEYKKSNYKIKDEVLIRFKSLSTISCNLKSHDIVPSVWYVPVISKDEYIKLPIHSCNTCGKKFIGEKTLEQYSQVYEKFYLRTTEENTDINIFHAFSKESKLHALGYNVIDGEMTDRERQELLVFLIQEGKITYFEVCRDIEKAISLFRSNKRFSLAIKKWTSDLRFIGDYIKSLSS